MVIIGFKIWQLGRKSVILQAKTYSKTKQI